MARVSVQKLMERRAVKDFPIHSSSPKEGTSGPQQLKMSVFSTFAPQEGSQSQRIAKGILDGIEYTGR